MPQARKPDRVIQSYRLLLAKEKADEPFTVDEVVNTIGWARSSVTTYISKKWDKFLTRDGDKFYVKGVSGYQEDEYVRLMSQKDKLSNDPRKPLLGVEVERLVVKAREAAMHALDGYNRPSTIFRSEGFTVMMVIAWRSLFHAIFEKRGINYFYLNDDGTPKMIDGEEKAWELSLCVKEYFGDSNNAIRANLEFMIGLRNRIEHRYVPALDPHIAGECQALILNFDNLLVEEFGDFYALREALAVPIQTSNMRSAAQMEVVKQFQGKQYDDLIDYVEAFRAELPDAIYQDQQFSFRVYLIPKTGNHESSSDLAFEFVKYDPTKPEDMKALQRHVTLIKERQVPVANPGTYKPSRVAKLVAERTGRPFKTHHHTLAWKMYGVRKSGETPEGCNTTYCQFDQVHSDYIYTQEWVDFLVRKMSDEAEYNRLLAYKEK
jgi:hypothetical protein